MHAVEVKSLSKKYDNQPIVENVNFKINKGEMISLVGPSGCGKTTILRLLAGFEKLDKGSILLNGKIVSSPNNHTPIEKRGIGMVFQDFALFPHLTVFDNLAFGIQEKTKTQIDENVNSMLSLIDLANFGNRYPHELSGGQRQRVSLGRALIPKPILILLDEPFSNLDANIRKQMREDIRVILKGTNATSIFVTHDQEESLFMGDRIMVMQKGKLLQIGSPEDIFHKPYSRNVAEFMGQTGFIHGITTEKGISTELGLIHQIAEIENGTKIDIGIRADDISFSVDPKGESIILARDFLGAMNAYKVRLPSGHIVQTISPHEKVYNPGTRVRIWADPGHSLALFLGDKTINYTYIAEN
jgi:iron(III) transport system ATP-binding protein